MFDQIGETMRYPVVVMILLIGAHTVARADTTTITVSDSKGKPVQNTLIVVYDAGKNSVVAQGKTDVVGNAEVTVNVKARTGRERSRYWRSFEGTSGHCAPGRGPTRHLMCEA